VDPPRLGVGSLPCIIPPLHRCAGLFELGSPFKLLLDDSLGDLFVDAGAPELSIYPVRAITFAGLVARRIPCELLVVKVPKLLQTGQDPPHRLPSIPGPRQPLTKLVGRSCPVP
jgi:hypothetical protein